MLFESKGYRFQHILILFEGCTHGIFCGWDYHVQVLLLEDLCNRSPGLGVLVVQEEATYLLPVGCPMDVLPQII